MDDIYINRKQFTAYFKLSYVTGLKRYKEYLEIAGKEKCQMLSIYDIRAIEKVPLDYIKKRLGIN